MADACFSLLHRLTKPVFDPRGCTNGFSCIGTLVMHQGSCVDFVVRILCNLKSYIKSSSCNIVACTWKNHLS
ncbi:hypothetical protein HanPI659440_Chr12g0474131 [Helianthus annuus]|nr:hypothetical protein HanPI659440_Chr12g0474131 [Helianthus annuus]